MSEFLDNSVVIKFSCYKPDGLVFIEFIVFPLKVVQVVFNTVRPCIRCFPLKKLSKLFKLSLNNVRPCIYCFPLKKLSKLSLKIGKAMYELS